MHFGKVWPTQSKNLMIFGNNIHGQGPSYKVNLVFIPPTVGAKPQEAIWSGVDIVSDDPTDYWPDDNTWVWWRFTHPSDSDAFFTLRFRLEPTGLTNPNDDHYQYHWHSEYSYHGVVVGDQDWIRVQDNFAWVHANSTHSPPLTWLHLVDSSQFERMRWLEGAATWAMVPEFHPYRYEP